MATPQQIADRIATQFASRLLATLVDDKHPRVHINAPDWADVARFLHSDEDLAFDWLRCLGGVDYAADGKFCVIIDLWSTRHRHDWCVKVFCERDRPVVPSVAELWPAANWHEREAFDLFGIIFEDHPDLRRILMADDWEGYPLRKDYVFPRSYHGIPGSVELDWQQAK